MGKTRIQHKAYTQPTESNREKSLHRLRTERGPAGGNHMCTEMQVERGDRA